MEIVFSTLIHQNLFSLGQLEGTLVEIEYLFKEIPEKVVDKVELPEPNVVKFVHEQERVCFDLLLNVLFSLRISLL